MKKLMYENKLILAPMVRVGTLPMRLLALDFGADIVYSEEIIDYRILRCKRIENHILGTVDFVDDTENSIVFRTCNKEKNHVVFQMGTCDPERAVKVAKLVENDVAAIDVNMGCPKEFSLKGGMGAALLTQSEKIYQILTSLVQNTHRPVTCKIRVLPNLQETVNLCKLIESTGVSAIAIHGRTKDERPRHCNRNDVIKTVASILKIPVIANGGSKEIQTYCDIEKFRQETGAASVMIARAAQWNCSVFQEKEKLPLEDVIKSFLKYAVDYDNHPLNTKYVIQQMLQELQETATGKALLASKTLLEICDVWDLGNYYENKQAEFSGRTNKLNKMHLLSEDEIDPISVKKLKKESSPVYKMDIKFIRSHYKDSELPKTVLLMWTRKKKISQPVYSTEHKDKLFKSIVSVNGQKYTTTTWEKNKRSAEQAAALVSIQMIDDFKKNSKTSDFSDLKR